MTALICYLTVCNTANVFDALINWFDEGRANSLRRSSAERWWLA